MFRRNKLYHIACTFLADKQTDRQTDIQTQSMYYNIAHAVSSKG